MASHRIILLLACAPLFAQQYTISTIAGDGVAGASLNYPTSLAVDPSGNIYIADWSGFIHKVWAAGGATTVVAGTGILGYGGDGGPSINATIGKAVSIALDSNENLYLADGNNNRIRRIDAATGFIATVAGTGAAVDSGDGGPAAQAGVNMPSGLTFDAAGDLYFSTSFSRVRKLVASTGLVETVGGQFVTSFAGDGGPATQALFWDPIPSAVTPAGDLYIADFENSRIRLVSAKTGIVTTFAGSGDCTAVAPFNVTVCQGRFSGDGGPARDAALNYPAGAVLDSAGNLYIADTINHRIRRVDGATGLISTIAGNGVNGFSGDGGPALAAEISFPAAIAIDRSGRVYFADENNNRIRVLTPVVRPLEQFRLRPPR